MKLDEYLRRIGIQDTVRPDLASLITLHRQHALSISYENVDVQLRRPLDLDIERIFDKIVVRGRGGWCYEMNGLLGWALSEIGFEVTRMSGGVMCSLHGDSAMGNHLVLLVEVEGERDRYIADVGLGDGALDPLPLRSGLMQQGSREYALQQLDGKYWRFRNHLGVVPLDFDFVLGAADERVLAQTCNQLQEDAESLFRQNLICMRKRSDHSSETLIGRTYKSRTGKQRVITDAGEFAEVLRRRFDLETPHHSELWTLVCARHEELFGTDSAESFSSDAD